jgi:sec-independent protein translocase protein TatB
MAPYRGGTRWRRSRHKLWRRAKKVVTVRSRDDCRFSASGYMMNRMSFSETIFLFFLALIIFGPKKLPEIARTVGKALNEFKRASNEFKSQIEQEISNLEVEKRQTILPPSPPVEGTTSRALSTSSGEGSPAVAPATEVPTTEPSAATLAASDDEPLFATGGGTESNATPLATEAVPSSENGTSENVTSPRSQESHV